MTSQTTRWVCLLAFLVLALALPAESADQGPLATTSYGGSGISWTPQVSYACMALTVSGPGKPFEQRFGDSETPIFELPPQAKDGSYRWSLSRSLQPCDAKPPEPDPDTPSDDDGRTEKQRRMQKRMSGPHSQSGHFRVVMGSIVVPDNGASEPRRAK